MMRFPGSLVYFICQILSAVLVSIFVPLFLMMPSVPRAKAIGVWAKFNIWTLKLFCGIDYRVTGAENIPAEPSIIISNHQSAWETLCFQEIFPAQSYILKKSLLFIPFFGWGLAANRPIAINRSKKLKALDQLVTLSKERLAEGRWLVVFPEGTRMPPGNMGDFQVGGAMMASKTRALVVPVAHNAGLFWPKRGFLKTPGTVDVVIGKPINPEGMKPREINGQVRDWIENQIKLLPGAN